MTVKISYANRIKTGFRAIVQTLMSLDEQYKLSVEKRLTSLETTTDDLKRLVATNNDSINALERTVARLSVIMPITSGLLLVLGYFLPHP